MRHCALFPLLLVIQITGISGHTLYQWIIDSRMRFNYDPDPRNPLGVYNWRRSYPESCGGHHQSPVDIDTARVQYGTNCPCPRMHYLSTTVMGELKNNGHSPTFELKNPHDFQLSDVPFRNGTYSMNDFHLHYGGVSGRTTELQGLRFRGSGIMSAGSEHTLDGLRFEGELHFVFYNNKYGGLEQADSKHDGVVVIVILVQKIPGTMADNGETSMFSQLLENNIPRIFPYQMNVTTALDLGVFFTRDCEFYTYTGSTTTPTCHESVRWIILREPIRVTERAWFLLTGLQSRGDFNSRFGNYRTTQPLNDRTIVANFQRARGIRLPSPNGEQRTGLPGMTRTTMMPPMMPGMPQAMPPMPVMRLMPGMSPAVPMMPPMGGVPGMQSAMPAMPMMGRMPGLSGMAQAMPPMLQKGNAPAMQAMSAVGPSGPVPQMMTGGTRAMTGQHLSRMTMMMPSRIALARYMPSASAMPSMQRAFDHAWQMQRQAMLRKMRLRMYPAIHGV